MSEPGRKRVITRDDILPMAEFAALRREKRQSMIAMKRDRRVEVGPFATFYFENYDTMWMQIHEMLLVEGGGEDQIAGELDAYNPLIPNGRELVATVMIEIDDEKRRRTVLGRLGGFENTITITFDGETVTAVPEADIDRTTADGKASSVQFVHFPFTDAQIAKFRAAAGQVILGIGHDNYAHMAVLPDPVKTALAGDFDKT